VGRNKATHDVRYDDTPITLHAADVLDRLEREGPTMPFERLFEGRSRGEMVGLFLALLELIRQQRVRVQQELAFGTIVVTLIDATPITTVLEAGAADATPEPDDAAEADDAFEEEEEMEDAPFEEVGPDAPREALFEDEEEEEEDEFSRRIKAVEIAEVDLGRSLDERLDDAGEWQRERDKPGSESLGSSGDNP